MSTWIALFRGINVGGHNKLPMKELGQLLEGLGLENPKTVIQSGNVVFATTRKSGVALARDIENAVESTYGFRPAVLVLRDRDFLSRLAANPFPGATGEPKTLHLFFAAEPPPHPDLEGIARRCAATESWHLEGDVFFLHAPDGIARSKLAANVEKLLAVPGTSRNWNTVQKLRALIDE